MFEDQPREVREDMIGAWQAVKHQYIECYTCQTFNQNVAVLAVRLKCKASATVPAKSKGCLSVEIKVLNAETHQMFICEGNASLPLVVAPY